MNSCLPVLTPEPCLIILIGKRKKYVSNYFNKCINTDFSSLENSLVLFNLAGKIVTESITQEPDSYSVLFHNFKDYTLIYPAAE